MAAVRHAVRATLSDLDRDGVVYAAVSGGADSLALLAALAFEAPRAGRAPAVVHVDHALQPESAAQADRVVSQARALGVTEARVIAATIRRSRAGPEGGARAARYAVLDTLAAEPTTATVLLAHSRDDQAEQVLLGLARGSGARSLAGMAPVRGAYRRPLLHLGRATLVDACRRQGLLPWTDPTNADLAFTRNRVRHRVLPVLEAELGPGVGEALARTAELLRDDADLLDALAADAHDACGPHGAAGSTTLDVTALGALAPALRTRVLRRVALAAGAPATDLTFAHVRAVDALVTRWHGQGPVSLPGGLVAVRRCDRLVVEAP